MPPAKEMGPEEESLLAESIQKAPQQAGEEGSELSCCIVVYRRTVLGEVLGVCKFAWSHLRVGNKSKSIYLL